MRIFLFLLFICPSAFAAYTDMVIEGVKQSNGVWTTAGVMDTQGFVRTTAQVSVYGTTKNLPVAIAADTAAAGAMVRGAARLAGPIALAATAYDVYDWVTSDDITSSGNEWVTATPESYETGYFAGDEYNIGNYWFSYSPNSLCKIASNNNKNLYLWSPNYTITYNSPDSYTCQLLTIHGGTLKSYGMLRKTCRVGSTSISCVLPPKLEDSAWDDLGIPPIPIIISAWNNIPSLTPQPTPIKSTDFTPFSEWMGAPYFKDGNWWRDRMDVSPAPLPGQPTRVRIDIGPVKLEGMTDPNVKPDDTPASGSTAPKEQTKFCDDNPMSIACAEMGELEEDEITPEERPFQIAPKSPWGSDNASCPAPKVIQLGSGQSVSITYQPTCDFLSGVRPAVLALAFLAALYIALGIPVGKGD